MRLVDGDNYGGWVRLRSGRPLESNYLTCVLPHRLCQFDQSLNTTAVVHLSYGYRYAQGHLYSIVMTIDI